MIIRYFTSIFVLLLLWNNVFAQDFRAGYIILNGDTINGLVNFGLNKKNEKYCTFKYFDLSEIITFSPENIEEWSITGVRSYRSVQIDNQKIFAVYIVKGKASILFSYSLKKFLLLSEHGILTELSTNSLQGLSINKTDKIVFNNYTDVLNYYLSDSLITSDKYNNTKLSETDLTRVVTEYNAAGNIKTEVIDYALHSNDRLLYASPFSKTSLFNVGIEQGIVFTNPVANELPLAINKKIYNSDKNTSYFAGIYFTLNKRTKGSSFGISSGVYLQNQFLQFHNKSDGFSSYYYINFVNDMYIKSTYLKIPLLFETSKIIRKKTSFYFNAGISKALFLSTQMYSQLQTILVSEKIFKVQEVTASLNRIISNYAGYSVGAGIKYAYQQTRWATIYLFYETYETNWGLERKPDMVSSFSIAIRLNI